MVAISVVLVVVQLVFAGISYTHPRPARFGWHMFAARKPRPDVSIVLESGERRKIQPITRYRTEVTYRTKVGPYVCGRYEHAEVVLFRSQAEGSAKHRC